MGDKPKKTSKPPKRKTEGKINNYNLAFFFLVCLIIASCCLWISYNYPSKAYQLTDHNWAKPLEDGEVPKPVYYGFWIELGRSVYLILLVILLLTKAYGEDLRMLFFGMSDRYEKRERGIRLFMIGLNIVCLAAWGWFLWVHHVQKGPIAMVGEVFSSGSYWNTPLHNPERLGFAEFILIPYRQYFLYSFVNFVVACHTLFIVGLFNAMCGSSALDRMMCEFKEELEKFNTSTCPCNRHESIEGGGVRLNCTVLFSKFTDKFHRSAEILGCFRFPFLGLGCGISYEHWLGIHTLTDPAKSWDRMGWLILALVMVIYGFMYMQYEISFRRFHHRLVEMGCHKAGEFVEKFGPGALFGLNHRKYFLLDLMIAVLILNTPVLDNLQKCLP